MNLKKLAVAFAAAAAVILSPFTSAPAANAAWTNDIPGGWAKTECYDWNPVELPGRQTCFTESYPGPRPPHWETQAFTPFFDGRLVRYTPGRAVQWDR